MSSVTMKGIPRVLFVCDQRPHAHDYGVDFLIQGAYSLLGAENVFEWPEKPNLHLSVWEGRDACQIDSDAWLPAKGLPLTELRTMASKGWFDVVILTTSYGTWGAWSAVCSGVPPQVPVIGLHYDDQLIDTRDLLERITGRKLTAYWHREGELPTGARRLYFSQPRARIRPVQWKPNLRPVFYAGARHDDPNDAPRARMAASIAGSIKGAEVRVTNNQIAGRLLPETYRDRLWESSISVLWNTSENFPTWQSNRFVESLALGCAVIAEKPPYKVLANEGVHWITAPEDAGGVAQALLNDPTRLQRSQEAASELFLTHYTSEGLMSHQLLAGIV